MTRPMAHLSDEALAAALSIATARRATTGCLGARMELAALRAEYDRRLEILELEQTWDASS